jgi:hypothetical protein
MGAHTQVTLCHIKDFFVDFARNDSLGQIANAWVAWADMEVGVSNAMQQTHASAQQTHANAQHTQWLRPYPPTTP